MLGVTWASRLRRCGNTSAESRPIRAGARDVLTSEEREEIEALRREVAQLRRANEILKAARCAHLCFSPGSSTRPTEVTHYVEEHRGRFGVEPICSTLGVSASAYYRRKTGQRSARALEDKRLLGLIHELHEANYCVYG